MLDSIKVIYMYQLIEYVKDQIWIFEYPVRFGGMDLFARTTIIKLDNQELIVHDPSNIDDAIKSEIDSLALLTKSPERFDTSCST